MFYPRLFTVWFIAVGTAGRYFSKKSRKKRQKLPKQLNLSAFFLNYHLTIVQLYVSIYIWIITIALASKSREAEKGWKGITGDSPIGVSSFRKTKTENLMRGFFHAMGIITKLAQ